MSAHPGGPPWLLAGLTAGAVFAVLVAVVFFAGERLFPTPPTDGPRRGGDWKRREEIRSYLEAIGEHFREDEPLEGHEVAFYLPEREVAVTFDARAYLDVRDAGTDAVLCEHEMPGAQLGHRLPFEAPTFGDADVTGADGRDDRRDRDYRGERRGDSGGVTTDPGAVRAAFAVLGLPQDASGEAVRTAYRERVTEVHPDQGGDLEAFRRLQEAYALAREYAADGPRARAGD